ncbi:hypothetical protein [Leucobacter luti]|uniref:hypothetical protein n=1 Tax=Leucobacter luti TaxID=340320 RepID=UPI003D048B84
MSSVDVEKIRAEYTAPFYLELPDLDEAQRELLACTARGARFDEVLWMLETEEWRCRRMGAWFALMRDEPGAVEAIFASLATSRGEYTAPDLGVALAQRVGSSALPAIFACHRRGVEEQRGPQGLLSALVRELGGDPEPDDATEVHRARVTRMRETAARLAALRPWV